MQRKTRRLKKRGKKVSRPRQTMRGKMRSFRRTMRGGFRRTMRGGFNDSWRLPKEATVIWRNLQDGEFEDAVPVAMSYEEAREELEL
jgi:hypothetical protein